MGSIAICSRSLLLLSLASTAVPSGLDVIVVRKEGAAQFYKFVTHLLSSLC